MKKIFINIIILLFLFFQNIFLYSLNGANCSFDGNGKVGDALSNCVSSTKLAGTNVGDLKVDGKEFENKIKSWRNTLAMYLGIAAVFGLVFAGFTLATSAGEEEKIKKAKDLAKWTIIGFLSIIFAATIITFVITLFYSI